MKPEHTQAHRHACLVKAATRVSPQPERNETPDRIIADL